MNVIAYFAFTLISVLVQFSIMDYINANANIENINYDLNITATSQKKTVREPYAIFYLKNARLISNSSNSKYNDSSNESDISTESIIVSSSTEVVFYDENVTTEDVFTSESPTTIEIENVTEFSIFNVNTNKSSSVPVPVTPRKRERINDCNCDLLNHLCDTNCCCDDDCTEHDLKLFNCTEKATSVTKDKDFYCESSGSPFTNIESMFCEARTNIPEKHIIVQTYDPSDVNEITKGSLKWHDQDYRNIGTRAVDSPKIYQTGDSVLFMRNGSFFTIDVPFATATNYCNAKKNVKLFKKEKTKCVVPLPDLHMFDTLKNMETFVISVKNNTAVSSAQLKNCSTVHCTSWNMIVCDGMACGPYNKTVHEPFCTNITCNNIALHVEYIFYYNDTKIVNASVYLKNIRTVSLYSRIQYFQQEISVAFYKASNYSVDHFVMLSGNPGYEKGRPVIASYVEGNHTSNFFQVNNTLSRHLLYPANENGHCILSNLTKETIQFGVNKRSSCLLQYTNVLLTNASLSCQRLNDHIKKFLKLDKKASISTLGNPDGLEDKDWIPLSENIPNSDAIQGQFSKDKEVLNCYNIISSVIYVFGFADVSEKSGINKFKILSAERSVSTDKLSLDVDAMTFLLMVDMNFVDVSEPPVYEYAASPQLHIHLPKDFFFPFSLSKSSSFNCYILMYSVCFIVTLTNSGLYS